MKNHESETAHRRGQWRAVPWVLPLALLLFGLLFLYKSLTDYIFIRDGIPGDGFFPTLMSILVTVCSAVALVRSFKQTSDKTVYWQDLLPMIMIVAMCLAAKVIGTFPALLVMLIVWFKVIEKMSWKSTLLISVIYIVLMYLIFKVWIGIRFDTGLLGQLLDL